MSNADWLFVCVVAAFVTALLALDWLRSRRHRNLHDLDTYQRHQRLMAELRRQP